jgi:hypothetical protein
MGKTSSALSIPALISALAILGFLEVAAQTQTPVGALQSSQEVAGKVRLLDESGRKLTLHDGTVLILPSGLSIDRSLLQPGTVVKVGYDEMAGEKIVNGLDVERTPRR